MKSNEGKNFYISIGAAIFAAFLLYSYSQEKKAEYDKKYGSTKRVVKAKEDIAEMQTIYENMLDVEELPSSFVQPDVISVPEEIVGNVAAVPIKKGQTIVKNHLLTPGPDTGIALQIAPTKRAVTIPIDEVRSAAKLIRPGDRVDVLAAVDAGKGLNQKREVQTLIQDVPVLATGVSVVNNLPRVFEIDSTGKKMEQIALTGDSKYSTITVEVSVPQAQDLVYLLSTAPGNIFLLLRNPNDRAIYQRLPSSTAESVLGKPVVSFENATPRLPATVAPAYSPQPSLQPQRPSAPTPKRPQGFRNL